MRRSRIVASIVGTMLAIVALLLEVSPVGERLPAGEHSDRAARPPSLSGNDSQPAADMAAVWESWPRPPRVGLQVGHWNSAAAPDELARLRHNSGTAGGGYTELEVNLRVATLVKDRLEAAGVVVDLIPATVPIRYQADAFVAIHADGFWSPEKRGWKLATYWRSSPASEKLAAWLLAHYNTLGLPYDPKVTANMRGYYAFNRRFSHAIASTTPGVILELGFLTNAEDRAMLVNEPERLADAIAMGILSYLRDHDPLDASLRLTPPDPAPVRPQAPITAYSGPSERSPAIRTIYPAEILYPISRERGWYKVPLPPDLSRIGWVRVRDVIEARPRARWR